MTNQSETNNHDGPTWNAISMKVTRKIERVAEKILTAVDDMSKLFTPPSLRPIVSKTEKRVFMKTTNHPFSLGSGARNFRLASKSKPGNTMNVSKNTYNNEYSSPCVFEKLLFAK